MRFIIRSIMKTYSIHKGVKVHNQSLGKTGFYFDKLAPTAIGTSLVNSNLELT